MPRCKNCKDKYEAKHFNQKYCFRSACVKVWVETAKDKAKKKKEKQIKDEVKKLKQQWFPEKDQGVQKLVLIVQKTFNEFIRSRDAGLNCISCKKPPKKKNAGHYHSANISWATRFDERNVNLQCESCNNNLSGNLIKYGKNLKLKIGLDEYNKLDELAQTTRNFTREELKEINKKYKKKIKEL